MTTSGLQTIAVPRSFAVELFILVDINIVRQKKTCKNHKSTLILHLLLSFNRKNKELFFGVLNVFIYSRFSRSQCI
jgi:hypothetical protein